MSAAVVEVRDDETYAYYTGYVKDFRASDERVLVHFEPDWKEEWVDAGKVRQSVPAADFRVFNPQVGHEVEALARSSPDEPFSWWRAEVKTVRGGEFYLIGYSDWDETYNEIVEKELLRPVNPNPHLDGSKLVRRTVPLPKSMWEKHNMDETFRTQKQETFVDLQKTSSVLSLIEDQRKHELTLIGYPQSVEGCVVLCQLAFKQHEEKLKLKRRIQQSKEFLENEKQKVLRGVVVSFLVPVDLIGLVIGKKGGNISKTKQLRGVISVKVTDVGGGKGEVKIVADDDEAANRAREELEFAQEVFKVPRRYFGKFAGQKFSTIKEIEAASKAHRISVPPREMQERNGDGMVELIVVGKKDTVSSAMVLLERHMSFVEECERLEQDHRQIDSELMSLSSQYGIQGRRGGGGGSQSRGGSRGSRRSHQSSNSQNHHQQQQQVQSSSTAPHQKPTPKQSKSSSKHKRKQKNSNRGTAAVTDEQQPPTAAAAAPTPTPPTTTTTMSEQPNQSDEHQDANASDDKPEAAVCGPSSTRGRGRGGRSGGRGRGGRRGRGLVVRTRPENSKSTDVTTTVVVAATSNGVEKNDSAAPTTVPTGAPKRSPRRRNKRSRRKRNSQRNNPSNNTNGEKNAKNNDDGNNNNNNNNNAVVAPKTTSNNATNDDAKPSVDQN